MTQQDCTDRTAQTGQVFKEHLSFSLTGAGSVNPTVNRVFRDTLNLSSDETSPLSNHLQMLSAPQTGSGPAAH